MIGSALFRPTRRADAVATRQVKGIEMFARSCHPPIGLSKRPAHHPRARAVRLGGAAIGGLLAAASSLPLAASASQIAHLRAPAAPPPAQWRQQAAPALPQYDLTSVSCPTDNFCVAVGAGGFGTGAPLAVSWDGVRWVRDTVPPSPTLVVRGAIAPSPILDSVSCAAGGSCVAVGSSGSEVLHDGTWRTVAIADAKHAQLNSVSCWTANGCMAVGPSTIEMYDGSSWSLEHAQPLAGLSLAAVSCLIATIPDLCTAVGWAGSEQRYRPVAEHANGADWQVTNIPPGPSATNAALESVSCPQPTSCVAVGSSVTTSSTKPEIAVPLVEIDQLNHWTVAATPVLSNSTPVLRGLGVDPDLGYGLVGVSCGLTVEQCVGVGTINGPSPGRAYLVEGSNGSSWAFQRLAHPPSFSGLDGVSCTPSPTNPTAPPICTAVGSYAGMNPRPGPPNGPDMPLIIRN